jgi:hypothetical protein
MCHRQVQARKHAKQSKWGRSDIPPPIANSIAAQWKDGLQLPQLAAFCPLPTAPHISPSAPHPTAPPKPTHLAHSVDAQGEDVLQLPQLAALLPCQLGGHMGQCQLLVAGHPGQLYGEGLTAAAAEVSLRG